MKLKQLQVFGDAFQATQTLTAASTITVRTRRAFDYIAVSSSADIVLTATPVLPVTGIQDRQHITIMNMGNFTITLPAGTGSGISLPSILNLQPNSSLSFVFSASLGLWVTASLPRIVAVSTGTPDGNKLVATLPTGLLSNTLVNWASPGTIGATTPAAIASTTFSATGTVTLSGTEAATSTSTGAVRVPNGGLSVGGAIYAGGNIFANGNQRVLTEITGIEAPAKNNTQVVHTGTTAETIVYTATIPAGTYDASDLLINEVWAGFTSSLNNKTVRIRIGANAATVLTTGTVIYQQVFTTNALLARVNHALRIISAASQIGMPIGVNGFGSFNSGTPPSYTINFAVQQTLVVTVQLANAGNTATFYGHTLFRV